MKRFCLFPTLVSWVAHIPRLSWSCMTSFLFSSSSGGIVFIINSLYLVRHASASSVILARWCCKLTLAASSSWSDVWIVLTECSAARWRPSAATRSYTFVNIWNKVSMTQREIGTAYSSHPDWPPSSWGAYTYLYELRKWYMRRLILANNWDCFSSCLINNADCKFSTMNWHRFYKLLCSRDPPCVLRLLPVWPAHSWP